MMRKYIIFVLLLLVVSSCKQVRVDETYTDAKIPKKLYKEAIIIIDRFISGYNLFLNQNITETYIDSFYLSSNQSFHIDILFSTKNVLFYIEKSAAERNTYDVYYSYTDTFLRLQEIKHDYNFSFVQNRIVENGFIIQNDSQLVIAEGNFVGSPNPFPLGNNSTLLIFQSTIELETEKLLTKFPGLIIYSSVTDINELKKTLTKGLKDFLEYEVLNKYLESEEFKKALVHPILKQYATEINRRKAEAINKIKDYPLWEIEKHIKKVNEVAKAYGLSSDYVDKMLKDEQYTPIAGKLFYYYANEMEFMKQWIALNLLLVLVSILIHKSKFRYNMLVVGGMAIFITASNSFVFSKRHDLIDFKYWLIPLLLWLISYIILYRDKVFASNVVK